MPSINISLETHGRGIQELIRALDNWSNLQLELNVKILGTWSHEFMRIFIASHKVRPPGVKNRLEDSISLEFFSTETEKGFVIGVDCDYWRAVNFGSNHLIGKSFYGMFYPGEPAPTQSAFRQGRWYEDEGGWGYRMIPKNPIPPMNFLENTKQYIESHITDLNKGLEKL